MSRNKQNTTIRFISFIYSTCFTKSRLHDVNHHHLGKVSADGCELLLCCLLFVCWRYKPGEEGRIHRQHCSMNPRRPQIVSRSVSHFQDGAVWVSVDDRRWWTPSEEDGCHYSLVRRRTNWAFFSNDAHKITWILIKPFRMYSDAFISVKDVIFSCRRCSHLFLYFTSQHANALGQ